MELGLNSVNLLYDRRSLDIIENFEYYSSPATPSAPFNNRIWKDSVILLSPLSKIYSKGIM